MRSVMENRIFFVEDEEPIRSLYRKAFEHQGYTVLTAKDGETALDIMRRKGLRNEFFMTTFYTVAQGYYALGNMGAAERVSLEALDLFPMHLDICHILASIYFKMQSLDKCMAMSHRYLNIYEEVIKHSNRFESFYCQSLTKKHQIFFGLACIHFFQNDIEKADRYFQRSFNESGRQIEKAEHICRFYLEHEIYVKALHWLIRACKDGQSQNAQDQVTIPSTRDRGALAYEVAETLCLRRQWHLAEEAISLAYQISPDSFDHNKFNQLLLSAEQENLQSPL